MLHCIVRPWRSNILPPRISLMDAKSSTKKTGAPAETVILTDNETGRSYELPLISGTVGPKVIDVRKLYGETGHFTFDPGYTSTGSCQSKITYIDGDQGE